MKRLTISMSLFLVGCLHTEALVHTSEKVTSSKTNTIALPSQFEVSATSSGGDLIVAVSKAEMCRDELVEALVVTDTMEKTLPKAHWAILGAGAVALAGGVVAAVVGSSMQADSPTGLPTPEQASARDTGAVLVPVGIGAAAVGGGLLVWDLANLFTSGTSDRERTTSRTTPSAKRVCLKSPEAGSVVTLRDGSGATLSATSDSAGRAAFALARIDDTFAGRWATRGDRGPGVNVTVGDRDAGSLDLSSVEEVQSLVSAKVQQQKEKEATRREQAAAQAAARSEAMGKISAQETQSGRCTQERLAQLQGVLSNLKTIGEGSDLYYSGHTIVPAGSAVWSGRVGIAGDYHLFAVGYEQQTLDVRNGAGQPSALASMYVAVLQNVSGGFTTSKVLQANAFEPFAAKVTSGRGCTLFVMFRAR